MRNTRLMDLRAYLPTDREACLAILDSNMPHFFAGEDRTRFESFLDQGGATYFVMEHDGAVIGCGGYRIAEESGVATLVWGMVRRDFQKMGLGRLLLMYRLREIGKASGIERVRLETPPLSAAFFEGQGFKVVNIASGHVEMMKKMSVCG
jgi:N-acetylglutamate synthase-like GNAT family acetyltransferase